MNSPVKIWRNQKSIAKILGKTGKIVSWTVIRVPPAGFSSLAPYPVVLVELTGGMRMTAQLVDLPAQAGWEEKYLKIGQRVVTIVRRVTEPNAEGIIPYGIKVKAL